MPIQECCANIITTVSNLIKLSQYNFPAQTLILNNIEVNPFCPFLLLKKVLCLLVCLFFLKKRVAFLRINIS